MMDDEYDPACNFLVWVLNGEAPLSGSEQAEANLQRVIALTADEDASNRDWAAFILGNCELNTPVIREALLARADDRIERVRAEAIWSLARKDRLSALPFIQRALKARSVTIPIFEAAAMVADGSLIEDLRHFAEKATGDWTDGVIANALSACETGIPRDC